jgi:hypothetical protein
VSLLEAVCLPEVVFPQEAASLLAPESLLAPASEQEPVSFWTLYWRPLWFF